MTLGLRNVASDFRAEILSGRPPTSALRPLPPSVARDPRLGQMDSIIFDTQHWLARAAEARAIASKMADPELKRQMLIIALGYERIARHAEEQAQLREKYKTSE
jgi:hypothetical protein